MARRKKKSVVKPKPELVSTGPVWLNNEQKSQSLVKFIETLSYDQMIVFSDEGNLTGTHRLYNSDQKIGVKPYGLWYSYGKAWINYLLDSATLHDYSRINKITHIYEIKINYENVLQINTIKEIEKFEKKYFDKSKTEIVWALMEKEGFHGIQIKCLNHYKYWYSGWDISSGCIWDRRGVDSIKLLKSWEPMWRETTNGDVK